MISRSQAFAVVEDVLGFRPEPTRGVEIEQAVSERLRARGYAEAASYRAALADARLRAAESRVLADRLTVNETYFLREPAHHEVLAAVVLAERARGGEPLRILSVGCSTGEEPYGIALSLIEAGWSRQEAEIVAIDASPAAIGRARSARYADRSVRNVPTELQRRHFNRDKNGSVLTDDVKAWVRFEVENVVDEASTFWTGKSFDVVFCRNLLIYLTPNATRRVVDRLAGALSTDGYLFLGHAETGLAGSRFSVHQAYDTFYFQLRDRTLPPPATTTRATPVPRRPAPRAPAVQPVVAARDDTEQAVLDLLRRERFAEALTLLEQAEPASEGGLLRAAVLTNLGRAAEAVLVCEARLEHQPSCAYSHYLLALCAESAENLGAARWHHARAATLDGAFAMPRLRGGMLARRAGDADEARRMLNEALAAFPSQNGRTQLLYGGGIATDALVTLCRAELSHCAKHR